MGIDTRKNKNPGLWAQGVYQTILTLNFILIIYLRDFLKIHGHRHKDSRDNTQHQNKCLSESAIEPCVIDFFEIESVCPCHSLL